MYTNVCEICGKNFETLQPKKKCCDDQHYKTCVICGSKFPVTKRNWRTKQCCSRECLEKWYKETVKSKEMHRKTEETKRKKYRDNGIAFNTPKKTRKCLICGEEFKPEAPNQKICSRVHVKTCEICGNEFQVKTMRQFKTTFTCSRKCKYKLMAKNNLEKYGCENVAKLDESKKKSKETCMKKYGTPYVPQSE